MFQPCVWSTTFPEFTFNGPGEAELRQAQMELMKVWCVFFLRRGVSHNISDLDSRQYLPSLKTNSSHPENGWLEYDRFLLSVGLFSGAFAVSFREGI